MWYAMSLVVFVACVQILLRSGNAGLAAGIFATLKVLLALLLGRGLVTASVIAAVLGVVAFVYFWLLDRAEDTSWWWPALIAGVLLLALS